MNSSECRKIAASIGLMARREWPSEKLEAFAQSLSFSSIGVVPYEVVSHALQRLLEELDPDAITLAKLVERTKMRPVTPMDPSRQLEDRSRYGRYQCTGEDRAALSSLRRAFASRGKAEAAEFERLMGRMVQRDGVDGVDDESVPF